ncbi:dynamin GTPase [Patellaria atrata CBS 101060]|uniref:Dynamin GTPase n=1 Tax=Patellaria atrata CBS 101060 TaxID=1346257 RepID=A0A9P4S106_9PEZI|nr:dynamin GTPase [Patellaria atrata CBS 101060]
MSSAPDTTYKKIGDPILLDKIDKLFACNVGEYIDLPQLVVLGDQSSGKSSVLEGLTRLPFPRDSGLCTKFATQITFRRASYHSVHVSILPDTNSTEDYKERIKEWNKSEIKQLDATTFASIIADVHTVMGLSHNTAHASGLRKTFSNDVLRLEIHGPDEAHLSVIDVPGIFRTTTAGITTTADKELVRNMVETYMRNPRTVMLVVVPANVDPATQEILEMAKEVDPNCHRTIGVFTKPDLVDKGAEPKVMEIIEGKGPDSQLEWSIVRNPGQQELNSSTMDRGALEESFFRRKAPWNTLPRERRGVNALRKRLEEVLAQHIRREFPKVKAEINKKLGECKHILDSLGAERETADKQTMYLLNLATRFQHIADLAVKADYGGDSIFDKLTALRLATQLVDRNERFSADMTDFGHQFQFEKSDDAAEKSSDTEASQLESDIMGEKQKHANTRYIANALELSEILFNEDTVTVSSPVAIHKWLKDMYKESRGFELGTFHSSLLTSAMRQQSTKWQVICSGYISDAVVLVHNFITTLLHSLCRDNRVSQGVLDMLLDGLIEKYKKSLAQAAFLVNVELSIVPMTLNHYFSDNLEKCRQQRIESEMESNSIDNCKHGSVVPLSFLVQAHPMSNFDHTTRDMHDILRSYYKVARKRFVDNVCMQAAGYHLVCGPDTPLKLFSPSFVLGLSQEQLQEIAGEDLGLKRKRAQLKQEIQDLETGRKILI